MYVTLRIRQKHLGFSSVSSWLVQPRLEYLFQTSFRRQHSKRIRQMVLTRYSPLLRLEPRAEYFDVRLFLKASQIDPQPALTVDGNSPAKSSQDGERGRKLCSRNPLPANLGTNSCRKTAA